MDVRQDDMEGTASGFHLQLSEPAELEHLKALRLSRIAYGTAAISSLPDEILQLIFEAGHESQAPDDQPFELLVSGTTRHWRYIALETPQLWTRIRCRMGPPEELEIIQTYLRRAAACPIEVVVSVHSGTFADALDTTGWRQLSTSLVGRCWRFLVHVPSDTHERAIRRYIDFLGPLRAPFLTSFEITRNLNSNHGPETEPVEVINGGAPMLHSVRLANPNPGGCRPPLSHVSVLRLVLPHVGFQSGCVYRILKSAPSLTHLELHGADIFSAWPANLPAINLPLLRTLSLASQSNLVRFYHALHAITAPSLDALCIRGFEALHDLEAQALPEFKFSTLRSLVWVTEGRLGQTRRDFPAAQIPHPVRGLFKAFSSIERLVYGGPYANELPRFLKEADVAGDKCWRQLRVIALQCLAPPAVSVVPEHTDDEAHELMARRRAVGMPIEVAFISSSLAWPWTVFDTVFPDVQEYLDVLDDAEAGG